ncbi:MAG: tripartite tricarboxylate transporter TctB family protein [Pseudomonadota bacterium]
MPARLADLFFCLLGLGVALAAAVSLFGGARGAGIGALGDMTSPAFFPAIGAIALALASLAIAWRGLTAPAAPPIAWPGFRPLLVLVAVFAMIVAVVSGPVGFLEMLFFGLLALPPLFGLRDLRLILPTAVVVPLCVHLLFERVLLVRFPDGILF